MEQILIADLASPAHGEAIVQLLDEYASGETGGAAGLSPFAKANLLPELRRRVGAHAVVAFADELPAGLAICFEGFSTFRCKPLLNVHDLVVSSRFRGRGIGRRLLARTAELAAGLGCCKITLEVLEGNAIAQRLYADCGYAPYQLDPRMGRAIFWQKWIE